MTALEFAEHIEEETKRIHGQLCWLGLIPLQGYLTQHASHVTASLESKLQWALSNLCEKHKEINTMSSGPCRMCEVASLTKDNSNQHATIEKMSTEFAKLAAEAHMQERQHEGDKYVISDLRARVESLTQENAQLKQELTEKDECLYCGHNRSFHNGSRIIDSPNTECLHPTVNEDGDDDECDCTEFQGAAVRVESLEKALMEVQKEIATHLHPTLTEMKIGEIARKALDTK